MTDLLRAARFAVYLVPPTSSPFYQLGSQLLGYDVRAQQQLPLPEFLRPEWQESAAPYGFHLTVVEGFYTDSAKFSAIEEEARWCLGCFSPGADLTLGGGHLEAWEDGRVWVQRFEASPAFLMLHTLLSARLAPFVTASPFDAEVAAGKWQRPFEVARMRLLRTPRGLDTYQPHFTLVQPYGGGDPDGLRARLETLTRPFERLEVGSLALCVKPAGDTHWHLQTEWPLPLT